MHRLVVVACFVVALAFLVRSAPTNDKNKPSDNPFEDSLFGAMILPKGAQGSSAFNVTRANTSGGAFPPLTNTGGSGGPGGMGGPASVNFDGAPNSVNVIILNANIQNLSAVDWTKLVAQMQQGGKMNGTKPLPFRP